MHSKMKKQKRKLISRIGIVLFCVWLVLSAVYSVIVINTKADKFVNDAIKNSTQLHQYLSELHSSAYDYSVCHYIDMARTDMFFYPDDLSNKSYKNGTAIYNSDIYITAQIQDHKNSKHYDSNNIVSLTFAYLNKPYETRNYENGILHYDSFIASITPEELAEIKDYLNKKPDKDGYYYELMCTEYYYNEADNLLIPKTVELVQSKQSHTWYAQDKVIETYSLSPKNTKNCVLRKLPRDARNVIPDQIVTGDFIYDTSIGGVCICTDGSIGTSSDTQFVFPFNYIYSSVCTTPGYIIVSTEEYEAEYSQLHLIICYSEKTNLLADSAALLLAGYGIIFLFLLIIGIILVLSLWTIIKTQDTEEQKRREVTNSLAHDIKTPLFIIEGYAQSLKENLHTDKREHYADRIMERTRECNRLVHQMLSFSSLDSPDFELSTEDIDAEALLREIISDYAQVSDTSRIVLTAKEPCVVTADRELLKRALSNLTENALRHSDKDTEITINLTEKQLSISNLCSAITDEDMKHITEPFYRAEKNRQTEGSGLGLAMVDSVAKLHGFTLSATLSEGIVTLTLTFKK